MYYTTLSLRDAKKKTAARTTEPMTLLGNVSLNYPLIATIMILCSIAGVSAISSTVLGFYL